ncbi:hypothetical protein G6F52_004122 [Rhizopus delemar]|nr:hypothetical protein G6F52_004122 [Rhizopus delemar]
MKLFGMSESAMVDFIIATAQKSPSPQDLYNSLVRAGANSDSSTQQFCSDLFGRVPREQPRSRTTAAAIAEKQARKREAKEQAKLRKANESFQVLLEDDQQLDESSDDIRKKEKKIRKKRKQDDLSDDDTEVKTTDRRKRDKEGEEEDRKKEEMDEETRAEIERLKDIQERDELAQRLKDKDKNKTKKVVEDRSAKEGSEAYKRRNLADDKEARQKALPELRVLSNQKYLKLREEQQLLLLEKEIEDEERFFSGQKMTKREIRDLEYKKEVLRLAKARMQIDTKEDGYMLPEDYITEKGKIDRKRKEDALYQRYKEEEKFETEHEQWEKSQIQKSAVKLQKREEDDYDYVFDEDQKIDFVLSAKLNEPDQKDAELLQRIDEAERKAKSIDDVRKSLPIYQYRDELIQAIHDYQVLIIVGETGSGKTTQLPQYLYEAGYTKNGMKIGCTQPRRVAAMSVASRVAEEMGVHLGQEVGYSIRFEDCTSEKTAVKYMTDGMLLREFMTEPDLASYSCMIIDEAHERTLSTDILFGLIKDIARFRPDLKLLISSATMNAQKFSEYFDDAPIFNIPGRPYPVEIYYTKAPEANYLRAAITQVLTIHVTQSRGDILVFLTGQDEIEAAQEGLTQACKALGSKISELIVCPIYANLPSEMQSRIFEPTPEGARKVILATNIAETSITVDGVSYVIDPGFNKQKSFNPRTGMEALTVVPCSRASSTQRAGRAGRTGPGKCFRLFTQWAFYNEMEENTVPEIQRVNLSNVVLLLKSLGINDLVNFDFLDPPVEDTMIRSLSQLYALGALNDRAELTKLGRRMAEFPIDPCMSKAIVAAEKYECTDEVVSICAMLSEQSSLLYRPKDKKILADTAHQNLVKQGGDHLTLLNIWNQWVETDYSVQWCYENFIQVRTLERVRNVRDQLVQLLDRVEVKLVSNPNPNDPTNIQKAITSGFFFNASRLNKSGDSYRTVKQNQSVHIHPSSSMLEKKPRWVVYFELVLTTMTGADTVSRLEQYRRAFQKYASAEKENEKVMTKDDFLSAIAPKEDFKKIQKEQYELLYKLADRKGKDWVTFDDFVIFQDLISKPDAEYEVAFRLFDINGTGKVTFDQFKQVLSSHMPTDAVPFDFDCDWLKLYIGSKEGHHELSYHEFTQLIKGLQGERLRQEFKHYDKDQTGFILPEDFKKIILDVAKHKLSDDVIDHLPTLCNLYTGNKVSFSSVVAFHNVIRNIDMVESVIRKAIDASKEKKITKADFLKHAHEASRYTAFTPMEVDVIFHFAGVDDDSGVLGLEDFARVLDPRWTQSKPVEQAILPEKEVKEKKRGALWQIIDSAYSFTLGSIAGAVGATAVYPIDLVKTRMQNQRSKVVGELLYKNSLDCFKKVLKNEGFTGLYRGLGPQLVGVAPEKAIKLTVNDFVRSQFTNKQNGEIKFWQEMIGGGAAGASQVVFTNPLEIVKIRLQIQGEQAKHMPDAPRRSALWIVKHLGIVGLYKGVAACLLRDVPFSAIYFPAYAHLKKDVFHEGPDHKLKISELLMAGAIAGMPAAYFTTPADVIKTRLQVEARKGQTTYSGITDAAKKIYAEEGFKAFFKGGPARIFRSSPQFGVTLTVYELLHQFLPLPGHETTSATTPSPQKIASQIEVSERGQTFRSTNALKMLLDLDYRFGVYQPIKKEA